MHIKKIPEIVEITRIIAALDECDNASKTIYGLGYSKTLQSAMLLSVNECKNNLLNLLRQLGLQIE